MPMTVVLDDTNKDLQCPLNLLFRIFYIHNVKKKRIYMYKKNS